MEITPEMNIALNALLVVLLITHHLTYTWLVTAATAKASIESHHLKTYLIESEDLTF